MTRRPQTECTVKACDGEVRVTAVAVSRVTSYGTKSKVAYCADHWPEYKAKFAHRDSRIELKDVKVLESVESIAHSAKLMEEWREQSNATKKRYTYRATADGVKVSLEVIVTATSRKKAETLAIFHAAEELFSAQGDTVVDLISVEVL
jgi:hypothetical protein